MKFDFYRFALLLTILMTASCASFFGRRTFVRQIINSKDTYECRMETNYNDTGKYNVYSVEIYSNKSVNYDIGRITIWIGKTCLDNGESKSWISFHIMKKGLNKFNNIELHIDDAEYEFTDEHAYFSDWDYFISGNLHIPLNIELIDELKTSKKIRFIVPDYDILINAESALIVNSFMSDLDEFNFIKSDG